VAGPLARRPGRAGLTMAACPFPHDAGAGRDGYCPICGLAVADPGADAVSCAGCGSARTGGAFCERCGHPHEIGPAPDASRRPTRWVAVVDADRRQFEAFGGPARGFDFPVVPEWRIELGPDVVRIGHAAGATDGAPDVDLCGPPPDPGVSRQHAELLRQPDGSWAVRDAGSTNGTFVGRHRLVPGAVMPLAAGDRIRLGLWTRITLVAD
jgi:FHA domain